jgi:hypothetical protein
MGQDTKNGVNSANHGSPMLTNLNPSGSDEDWNKELLADETFISNFL